MKKSLAIALLALAVSASSAMAQQGANDAGKTRSKSPAVAEGTARASDKTQKKEGGDCSPQRAGVRCSRPKPRKPWFFGD